MLFFPFFNFEFQRFGFHVWFPICLFPILRLSHPHRRLRSFSIAARRFVSRWVHSVVACFTWFCSASCRVRFNYVVPLCSFFIFNFENTCLVFRFQHVFLINFQLFNLNFLVLLFGFIILSLFFRFPFFYFQFCGRTIIYIGYERGCQHGDFGTPSGTQWAPNGARNRHSNEQM